MSNNIFAEFQAQVEAVIDRCRRGEITEQERDDLLRQMQLVDDTWGDVWMLSPRREWFRKARGSQTWARDFPVALVDGANLPPVEEMSLPQLYRAVHDCTRCPLYRGRTRPVPGEGNPQADIMFIGEGPGKHEDLQGRPFVGASGKFLDQLLHSIGYSRRDVYIANVVKCRPPGNRDPLPEELAACKPFLDRQIELVDPKVIVTLGRFSMARYFPGASISRIHGRPRRVDGRLIVPMFHPAAALYQPRWRPLITEDFQRLAKLVSEEKGKNAGS